MKAPVGRRPLFCIMLALLVGHPLLAANRVTVDQLEQMLAAQRAANKSDEVVAKQLAGYELTEQLTPQTLSHISAELQPGPRTAQAIDLLADFSTFLPPPQNEIPDVPTPDMMAQRNMINSAIQYIVKTLRHLPDLLATRTTRSFDDSPLVIGHSGYAPNADLHLVGTFTRPITYRDGREVLDSVDGDGVKRKAAAGPAGLTTWGEFGPVLGIVLSDAAKGRITWSRWQSSTEGRVAVFHFQVPKDASHYLVDYCCAWQVLNDAGSTGAPLSYHGTPGYHGDLYVDPATGAILRIVIEAELSGNDLITRAAISVQYATVEIGGSPFICPVRSLAVSGDRNRPGKSIGNATPVTRVNEVQFTDYHRFGSTSRIVSSDPQN